MNQESKEISNTEPIDPLAEAKAYLAKEGVALNEFPLDQVKRLQVLLTSEPDAGCRVWPDPTWDPNECQEACADFFYELNNLKAVIKAYGQKLPEKGVTP